MDIDNSPAELDSLPAFKCGFRPACEIKYKALNSQTIWSALDSAASESWLLFLAKILKNTHKNSFVCRNSGILDTENTKRNLK